MPNIQSIRKDFPILSKKVNNHDLVYFDNAASTQKPQRVIDTIKYYYENANANVHRGVHKLSVDATNLYEGSRKTVASFINANSNREIVFCRGATEAINLVASSYLESKLSEGDEILISQMEHHSNIVPWKLIADKNKAKLTVIPINQSGELNIDKLDSLLTDRTKLVAVNHISNSLGTINPIDEIIQQAHEKNIPVLVDGAQAIAHTEVDVQRLDCDFYVFSGHKCYGPTGIGCLYAKEEILEKMQPYQGGGEMIQTVTFEDITYNDIPYRFEAGTPNIAGAVGLGAALTYIKEIGLDKIYTREKELLEYFNTKAAEIEGLRIIGCAENKASIISFILEDIHAHDMATIMDENGIAIRAGHHCTMPVMQYFAVPATARVSLCVYNTTDEIDKFFDVLHLAGDIFR